MTQKHKVLRIGLIIGGALIVLLSAAAIWIGQYYKRIVREHLPEWVADASNGKYKSSVTDISINIITRRVRIKGLRLWYDSTVQHAVPDRMHYALFIPDMYASGIAWERLVRDKELSFKNLVLSAPQIRLTYTPDSLTPPPDTSTKEPGLKRIAVQQILVDNPDFIYEVPARQLKVSFNGGVIRLRDWLLEPGNPQPDTSRLFYAKHADLQLFKVVYTKAADPYKYSVDTVYIDQERHYVALSKLQIKTTTDKKTYYSKIGHQKDLFDVSFPVVQLYGLDLPAFLNRKTIMADTVVTDRGSVDVYFSRLYRPDPRTKLGRFPHQLLQKLPIKLNIAYVKVLHGHASYTEVNEETAQPGVLPFDNINGSVRNVTNDPAVIRQNAHCVANLEGKFMKTSGVQATFDFLLSDTMGVFSLVGKVQDVKDYQVSGQAKALGKVEIKTLDVQRVDVKMNADQYGAKGSVVVRYSNLELQVKQLGDGKQMKDKPLLSFLVNKLIIYPDNPMKGKDLRTADITVQRDPHKSFFNLIWRTVLEGAKQTAIRNQNVTDAMSKKK